VSSDPSADETTVFAIYSTRRDAEMAKEYLREADIETFVRADDAGGMHPQMQRPHGVKLVGMQSAAQDAYEALDEANLLPQPVEQRDDQEEAGETADLTMSMGGLAGTLGAVAVLLVLLYLLLA
jgi:hypothetical protein